MSSGACRVAPIMPHDREFAMNSCCRKAGKADTLATRRDKMSDPHHLTAKPLTAEEFAPFGDVLTAPRSEGRQNTDWEVPRFDRAKLCLSLSRRAPTTLPFSTRIMERHLQSQQIFLPLRV